MGNVSQSILERVFVKIDTTFGTAPTLAGADYMRHTKCNIAAIQNLIPSSDKTGSISATRGAIGGRGGTWSLDWEARPSGTAGTPPDCDPVLLAALGVYTNVAGTSDTYSLGSTPKTFTMGRYRQPSTMMQQIAHGCVVNELAINFEQNANCRFVASGSCFWVIDDKNFSALDTTGKCGLGAFPAEPASPTSSGSPLNGLTGVATIDGSTAIQLRAASVRINPAIEIPRDRLFGGQYGSAPERDVLSVTCDLTVIDEDIAAVTALYTKALAGTTIDIVLEMGTVAGNRIQIPLNDCLLPMPELTDDARKWASNLRGIRAYATSISSLDEVSIKFY